MRIATRLTSSLLLLGAAGCASILGLDQPWDLAQGAHCQPGDESFPCAGGLYCEPVSSTCQPTGGSGGGGGSGCVPETTEACTYTGPMGTKDVGTCKAGSRICNQDGAWEPCMGQVVPVAEDCGTPFDEDCSGTPNDGCPCEPGSMQACYTGPMATQHVGACKDGSQTCAQDGLGFGPCTGDVTPAANDSCLTPDDDDCDGMTNEDVGVGDGCVCLPDSMAPCYTGPMGTEGVGACTPGTWTCAADGTGYGACSGETLPGTEDCAAAGDEDCNGFACSEVKWAVGYGGSVGPPAVATGPNGEIAVLGFFSGTLQTPVGNLVSAGNSDTFLLYFAPDGTLVWAKRFGDAAVQYGGKVAIDAQGSVVIAVELFGSTDFGGGPLTTAGNIDLALAKFQSNGSHVWSKRFGDAQNQIPRGIAIQNGGTDIFVGGLLAGTMDLGLGTMTSAGADDLFVARFDTSGTIVWNKRFGDAAAQSVDHLTVDGAGGVFLVGTNSGSFNIGAGGATLINTAGFLGRLDGLGTGVCRAGLTSTVQLNTLRVAADALGNAWVSGKFSGTVNLGSGDIPGNGQADAFLGKFSAAAFCSNLDGWSYGSAAGELESALASGAGRITLGFTSPGPVDLGGGPLTSGGGRDVAVGTFDQTGGHLWGRMLGSTGDDLNLAVGITPSGYTIVAFSAPAPLDLGTGQLPAGLVVTALQP